MGINGINIVDSSAIAVLVACSVLSMCAGAAFGDWAFRNFQRKSAVLAMGAAGRREKLTVFFQQGIRPLLPAARWLLSKSPTLDDSMQSATILLSESGTKVSKDALLSDLLLVAFMALAVGSIVTGSLTFGIAIACVAFIGAVSFARNRFLKRNIAMREEIPEALRTLAMSFRSGHSLPQVLSDSSQECKGYLAYLFSVASDRIEMGATPEEALAVMRGNNRVPELSFVAVALDIQHQSGGRIALVLESATESIEGELKLARSLRVQTAQAKLSASIVTIMPFILIALFSLFSPDFLAPFFSSALGVAVLAIALIMQLSGVLMVRRMLNVGGV